ncbi:MAG: AAA family ATPase [Mariniblastus sp.]|nr:AAA family ATPase [Mariniblastus sp.]MDG2180371.1 AAA family ATPase [Mariniblastus sp.]
MQTQTGSSGGEINFQTSGGIPHPGDSEPTGSNDFVPRQPNSLLEAGLHRNDLFPLVLKFLFLHGNQSGGRIANQIRVPYGLIIPVLESLKSDMLIGHKSSSGVADYEYELSPKGVEQARIHLSRSTYCGSAPVTLVDYRKSILRQSVKNLKPTFEAVAEALNDLEVTDLQISQLGQAINSGKSMFLFGAPGNGKTSIATRAIRALSEHIWIPRSLTVGGEVIRVFDPSVHVAAPLPTTSGVLVEQGIDQRWVRIERPTIIVGGELEMKHLEATLSAVTGIIEAPIHVKSNCGCLVVDDFGRQQISTRELLNRWIVPMESGSDFVNLPSGRQISLPFEQLLIFSTNLEPTSLCDEAFLRRIPYKVEVFDPTETQFRNLFKREMSRMNFQVEYGVLDHLIEYHYKRPGRSFRFCHVLDILNQCRDFCEFHRKPNLFSKDICELAVLNYFSGMGNHLNG